MSSPTAHLQSNSEDETKWVQKINLIKIVEGD
jgi:hypothetical protein